MWLITTAALLYKERRNSAMINAWNSYSSMEPKQIIKPLMAGPHLAEACYYGRSRMIEMLLRMSSSILSERQRLKSPFNGLYTVIHEM